MLGFDQTADGIANLVRSGVRRRNRFLINFATKYRLADPPKFAEHTHRWQPESKRSCRSRCQFNGAKPVDPLQQLFCLLDPGFALRRFRRQSGSDHVYQRSTGIVIALIEPRIEFNEDELGLGATLMRVGFTRAFCAGIQFAPYQFDHRRLANTPGTGNTD